VTKRSVGVPAVLLVCSLVCGCSRGAASRSDVMRVKQTMTRELAALASGEGTLACSLTTISGRKKIERQVPGFGCEAIVALYGRKQTKPAKEALRTAHIRKVTINGDTATIRNADIVSARGSLHGVVPPSGVNILTKQHDGSWKISG